MNKVIETDRLILRPWQEEDLKPFAEMNADHLVRAFFPSVLSQYESDNSIKMFSEHMEKHGWGFWAIELKDTGEFIGFTGLQNVNFDAPFTPAVEIGWRLAFKHWGNGYATEAAKEVLSYGFDVLGLDEMVSFTSVHNVRSRHVMERIGMHHDPKDDFYHPRIPRENPLSLQALYRIQSREAAN